ncbi:MAG TPA: hypothetical protein VFZ61_04985 [Polyangiales bacterium]
MGGALLTPSAIGACGATVEVGFTQTPVLGSSDGGRVDSGLPPLSRMCGTKQADQACGAAEIVDCDGPQQLVTRLEPLDCDITRGFTGVPEEVASSCQDAFNGQSGDGCSKERTCVRRALVGCCLELAACQGDEPTLLRSRACAQNCPAVSPTVERGTEFKDCGALLSALSGWDDPYRALGAPCAGNFVCSAGRGDVSDRELPFTDELRLFFCVGRQVQVLDALPWFDVPLPEPDASMPEALDAGGADAGYRDAGLADAGARDAGLRDAGPADAAPADAGPLDAGVTDAEVGDAGAHDAADAGDAAP